jgi:hypothetical protein
MQINRLVSRLRANFHPRARLPIWGLRLILGGVLFAFSEIVMWQNPPAHTALEWLWRGLLYICLAALVIDVTVRFQARDLAGIALVGGFYGLLSTATVGRDVFVNLPWNLLIRGMGLQTGAGIYGLIFFVTVLQGRTIGPREIGGAAAIGALWGVWLKWYPVQKVTSWGAVTIESATLYLVGAFVLVGALFIVVGPRFRVVREQAMQLEWWEGLLVGAPIFIALFTGLLDERIIPVLPFLLVAGLIVIVCGALFLNRHDTEPSYLANITIAAPNAQTYVLLAVVFLVTGTLTASLVADADSPLGVGAYWLIVIAATLWLPAAMAIIGIRAYRRE